MKNFIKKIMGLMAKEAVQYAERLLGSGQGEAKKAVAIGYIVDLLPMPSIFNSLVSNFLGELIDESIEYAHSKLEPKES